MAPSFLSQVLTLAFCAALASGTSLQGVSDCGRASGCEGNFTSLVLNPTVPVRGQPISLKGIGTLGKQVTGGNATAVVTLNGASIFTAAVGTCGHTSVPLPLGLGTVSVDALSCPTNGDLTLGVTLTLPLIAPGGAYDIHLLAKDQDGNNAFCVDAQFNL